MKLMIEFEKLPILGIIRGIKPPEVEPLVEAVVESGLKTIEITMNTDRAQSLIKSAVKAASGRLVIGAGTVLTKDDLNKALDSGARFIVSPVVIDGVLNYCLKKSIPVFPGAFSPAEVYRAWSLGAYMVKVFPAKFFGPDYFKELKGPFADVKLLACGGVNKNNLADFFSNGASAVSFGASIFRREWLSTKKFSLIRDSIKELISAYKQRRQR